MYIFPMHVIVNIHHIKIRSNRLKTLLEKEYLGFEDTDGTTPLNNSLRNSPNRVCVRNKKQHLNDSDEIVAFIKMNDRLSIKEYPR
jgi:hypothetical protein